MLRQTNLTVPAIEVEPRIWFNPDLESVQFIVPGIIAIIMMIVGTVLTAVTIVKEKEQGTIEQIVSSPIRRYELWSVKSYPMPFWRISISCDCRRQLSAFRCHDQGAAWCFF